MQDPEATRVLRENDCFAIGARTEAINTRRVPIARQVQVVFAESLLCIL